MAVDVLIIRNKADAATNGTHAIGDGLKAHLEGKGLSVTDLSDEQASPANVTQWLKPSPVQTKKLVVGLDHGSCAAFYGEEGGEVRAVITNSNCEQLTKQLHVYTFACSTNGDNCVGQTAISKGSYSWLGYIEPVYVFTDPNSALFKELKSVIWSYITALAEGQTLEQAEAALRAAYKAKASQHWVFSYNLARLLLRKAANSMTIHSHNRVVVWRRNVQVDGLYAYGTQNRNVWAHFKGLGWKRLWPSHDTQVINQLSQLICAKSKGISVDFLEDDGRIKTLYV
jgi:hypothetical protein